jgi:hypothetical protein
LQGFLFGREFLVFLADLHLLQPAQAAQTHVENGFGLGFRQREAFDQNRLGLVLAADDADHFIEVQEDGQITFEDFEAAGDGVQPMIGAPYQHLVAVVEPGAEHFAQAHDAWGAGCIQDVHVHGEAGFERGGFE